MRPLIVPAGRK